MTHLCKVSPYRFIGCACPPIVYVVAHYKFIDTTMYHDTMPMAYAYLGTEVILDSVLCRQFQGLPLFFFSASPTWLVYLPTYSLANLPFILSFRASYHVYHLDAVHSCGC